MCEPDKEKEEVKEKLLRDVLESYSAEYLRLLGAWQEIERKAQNNITLAVLVQIKSDTALEKLKITGIDGSRLTKTYQNHPHISL